MKVLVLNCGSSSVKAQLIETDLDLMEKDEERTLAKISVERIGMSASIVRYNPTGKEPFQDTLEILEHRKAIDIILKLLADKERGVIESVSEIDACGHRMVHGGEKFTASTLITPEVLQEIHECSELAPLHNPHNLRGYRAAREYMKDIPHAAVFDTAFHMSMEPRAFLYGLPYVFYKEKRIRRYGFHGTSHRYVSGRLARLTGRPREEMKIVTCHLGNGASMAAVDRGRSVDTTMGFTPLEGLLMGTRCGDMDPAVILYIMGKEELTLAEANTLMNKHSGLYGISGVSHDMRELHKAAAGGNERARIALEVFAYRIKKYTGAYAAAMGGLDALIFTGGIGENDPQVRAMALEGLEFLGIRLDQGLNEKTSGGREGRVSAEDSPVQVWVIPTNEELVIARDTVKLVRGTTP